MTGGAQTAGRRPGPRRPQTLAAGEREHRVEQARQASERVEQHHTAIGQAAAERHDAIAALYGGGVSIRDIAALLEVTAPRIPAALVRARDRST